MLFKTVSEISSEWGIEVSEFQELSEQAVLLTDKFGKRFVLKKKRSLDEAKNEIKLLKYLEERQLEVQLPLRNRHGEYLVNLHDVCYCIFNYLKGMTFSAQECVQNPNAPKLFGGTLAKLHKITLDAEVATNFPSRDLYSQVSGWAINEVLKMDENHLLKEIFQELKEELEFIDKHLPKQLIHRDSHFSNIIFDVENLSGIIDFEIAENNVRIFDICYCCTSVLSEIFSDESLRNLWFNFVENIVREYHQENPLSDLELNSIRHIMLSIQTIFMAFFTGNPSLYEINKDMFLWISENKSTFEEMHLL